MPTRELQKYVYTHNVLKLIKTKRSIGSNILDKFYIKMLSKKHKQNTDDPNTKCEY